MISGRALHFVFKNADRKKNLYFFRDILGMQVVRHEEFDEGGCDAKCNGPYDNRWSKTMIGYGSEHTHFIMELTYNYGIHSYELGNELAGLTIRSRETIERAKAAKYPHAIEDGTFVLASPDGYKFYILNEPQPKDSDPVIRTTLNCSDLKKSLHYWHDILNMKIVQQQSRSIILQYDRFIQLELKQLDEPFNRATSYGRIVFAVPFAQQPLIDEIIRKHKCTILTPLLSLDTPGKATVRVLVVADPDGHEICFVDDEGFRQLSEPDAASADYFDTCIAEDPFQK